MNKKIYLTGAVRTPIGSLNGILAPVTAVTLGVISVKETILRGGIDARAVDEVIMGNVLQAGQGQNPARQIAIGCGLEQTVPSYTVNMVCGSGMKAVELAFQNILAGHASCIIAGGTESMTNAPYLLSAMRGGARCGHASADDSVVLDGLTDVFGKYHMGITAENIAERYGISRAEQDAYACESQKRYAAAAEKGLFNNEIVPVEYLKRKEKITVSKDEHPRPETNMQILAGLKPAFKKDGTVSAGNSSGINDGAASLIVCNDQFASENGIAENKFVQILDAVSVGCDPAFMGLGPVYAVKKILERNKLTAGDIGMWELNEAFAAQAIAVLKELNLSDEKVNTGGGAIALGHPIGASGCRIIVTLMYHMKRTGTEFGIASLCVGGGMGLAVLLKNCG